MVGVRDEKVFIEKRPGFVQIYTSEIREIYGSFSLVRFAELLAKVEVVHLVIKVKPRACSQESSMCQEKSRELALARIHPVH